MLELIKKADANLVGVGIVIEKGFQEGRSILESLGARVESLAIIDSIDNGDIKFR